MSLKLHSVLEHCVWCKLNLWGFIILKLCSVTGCTVQDAAWWSFIYLQFSAYHMNDIVGNLVSSCMIECSCTLREECSSLLRHPPPPLKKTVFKVFVFWLGVHSGTASWCLKKKKTNNKKEKREKFKITREKKWKIEDFQGTPVFCWLYAYLGQAQALDGNDWQVSPMYKKTAPSLHTPTSVQLMEKIG